MNKYRLSLDEMWFHRDGRINTWREEKAGPHLPTWLGSCPCRSAAKGSVRGGGGGGGGGGGVELTGSKPGSSTSSGGQFSTLSFKRGLPSPASANFWPNCSSCLLFLYIVEMVGRAGGINKCPCKDVHKFLSVVYRVQRWANCVLMTEYQYKYYSVSRK